MYFTGYRYIICSINVNVKSDDEIKVLSCNYHVGVINNIKCIKVYSVVKM